MVICAIVGCSKRSVRDNVSFFRIPYVNMKRNYKYSDLLRKRQDLWITRIKRIDLDETKIKHARICSLHFISGKPSSLEDVNNPDWAPSVNLGYGRPEKRVATVERYQRYAKRQKIDSEKKHMNPQASDDSEQRKIDSEENEMRPESSDDSEEIPSFTVEASTSKETVDEGCNTDLTIDTIDHLEKIEKDYSVLQQDYLSLKQNANFVQNLEIDSFDKDDEINFYTGLPNSKLLRILFDFVAPQINSSVNNKLSKFQEFILFLMRLRLNLLTQDLGYRFYISQETVCRIFSKWLDVMYMRLKKIVFWPERQNLVKTMPHSFKVALGDHIAVIIDCFEITINRPSSLKARAATWSNYKQRNTVKFLIGITPQGVVSFISLGWGGRTSDKFITEQCGILSNLIPGDVVLADRGFNNLNSVGFYCAKLVLPASARGKKQLDPVAIESTRNIASLRIHVERVIGQLRKKFRILKGVLPIEMCQSDNDNITQIDKIVHVCCALVNLMPSVVG